MCMALKFDLVWPEIVVLSTYYLFSHLTDTELSPKDLPAIKERLYSARSKWINIGLQLNIPL